MTILVAYAAVTADIEVPWCLQGQQIQQERKAFDLKVKIGDKIYDSTQEPIMLIMDDEVKEHISNMHPKAYNYCSCPDSMAENEIKAFMGIQGGEKIE